MVELEEWTGVGTECARVLLPLANYPLVRVANLDPLEAAYTKPIREACDGYAKPT